MPEQPDLMRRHALALLANWIGHAERLWRQLPSDPERGCYGTGYNGWGVQTVQKFVGAMAALAARPVPGVSAQTRDRARTMALAALRFNLDSHLSGPGRCTDNTQWGNTWISALGIERMMFAMPLLEPHLTGDDRAALRRVLTHEADWIANRFAKGQHAGVAADRWNHSGKNVPESNLWNGALLWRAATMYADHGEADLWRRKAHEFLMNAVSVPADADDRAIVAGREVRQWHAGANFFDDYALDHHGYLNVGYMVICVSNAAMLHFDMRAEGQAAPESLYHHQADLWRVLRRFVLDDGRLCRVGGDSRLRYTYCQEYLLPALLLAADRFGDEQALDVARRQIDLMQVEADYSGDGSFYGRRLEELARLSPYYYTRLESDRACVLGMAVRYLELLAPNTGAAAPPVRPDGVWHDAEHGAVLHRCPTRLASFAWRAHGLAQGMCLPPRESSLAEWPCNLAGYVRFAGDDGAIHGGQTEHRRLAGHRTQTFEGGFVTCGTVIEGVNIAMAEGWRGDNLATHHIAFAALPDGHTVVGLGLCRTGPLRTYVAEVKGMLVNVPNDLYNGFSRRLATTGGEMTLLSPPPAGDDEPLDLAGRWVCIDGLVGVIGIYSEGTVGRPSLAVSRSAQRRGGKFRSLFVEEICWPLRTSRRGAWPAEPATCLIDAAWAVAASASPAQTRMLADSTERIPPKPGADAPAAELRAVALTGLDGRRYLVAANFGSAELPWSALLPGPSRRLDCDSATLPQRHAMVAALEGP